MSGGSGIGGVKAGGRGMSGAGADAVTGRLVWLDALKGVGILAVIAGHVWWRGPLRDALYLFHMPLFFMASGYTARFVPWRALLPRLARSMALPFLSFSSLLLAADFAIEGLRGVRPVFASWQAGAGAILFATETLRGPFTILWFIPCLLLARLVWNGLAAPRRAPTDGVVLAAMALIAALALLVDLRGPQSPFGHSPFGLLALPSALVMIWVGALWRRWGWPGPWAGGAIILFAFVALLRFPPVNMKMGDLGWPILSLAGAAAVTLGLAMLMRALPAAMVSVAARLGRASLVIMYVHVAFIHYLGPYATGLVLFAAALAASWSFDSFLRRWRVARLLFCGEPLTRRKPIEAR